MKLGAVACFAALTAKKIYDIFQNKPDEPKPFPHVPSGLSLQARKYLSSATPVGGEVTDPKLWALFRKGFREATIDVSNRDKEAHIAKSEDIQIGGVPVLVATPKNYEENSKVLVYLHGGAWTLGAPDHLYQIFAPISNALSLKTYAINYRLAPENPFPAGLDDCLNVYEELLKTHKAKDIFFFGDSAGANLCIATILKARNQGLDMPAAVGLNSPVVDAEKNSGSHYTLAHRDPKLLFEKSIAPSLKAYIASQNPQDPLISVINGDFTKGFPPCTIHVGSREILLGDAARLHEKLSVSGCDSSLYVFDGLWHGVQEHGFPESERTMKIMARFFSSCQKM